MGLERSGRVPLLFCMIRSIMVVSIDVSYSRVSGNYESGERRKKRMDEELLESRIENS